MNFGLIYGNILLLMGLIISLYVIMIQLFTHENIPYRGIRQSRWGQLALFFFLSLSIVGTILILSDIIWKDSIDFRVIIFPNLVGIAFDFLLIFQIFIAFLLMIKRVRFQTEGDRAGKFVIELKKEYEFIIILPFLLSSTSDNIGYVGTMLLLFVYAFFGASLLLLGLSLILIALTKLVFHKSPAY